MIKYLHDREGNMLSRQVVTLNDDTFDQVAKYLFEMVMDADKDEVGNEQPTDTEGR